MGSEDRAKGKRTMQTKVGLAVLDGGNIGCFAAERVGECCRSNETSSQRSEEDMVGTKCSRSCGEKHVRWQYR